MNLIIVYILSHWIFKTCFGVEIIYSDSLGIAASFRIKKFNDFNNLTAIFMIMSFKQQFWYLQKDLIGVLIL